MYSMVRQAVAYDILLVGFRGVVWSSEGIAQAGANAGLRRMRLLKVGG